MKRFLNDENLEPPSEKKMKPLPTMTADDLREIFLDQVTDPIWKEFIEKESQKQYFSTLLTKLAARCQKGDRIRPPLKDVFRAFNVPNFDQIKVVIVGQDPYPGPHDANGLAFAVNKGQKAPGSMINIFKNIKRDYPGTWEPDTTLLSWANQGVFLLNTVLTVTERQPASHQGMGWETFTDNALKFLVSRKDKIVFLLMGNHAQKKKCIARHCVMSPHPSPLSQRYFVNTSPFLDVNKMLLSLNLERIDWTAKN
uniref:Uracil-DNA glycosylase n=1 Tax=Panagrolaimus sp. JU765 TaxID=591449 RepID=A0AC34PUL1_9BILA